MPDGGNILETKEFNELVSTVQKIASTADGQKKALEQMNRDLEQVRQIASDTGIKGIVDPLVTQQVETMKKNILATVEGVDAAVKEASSKAEKMAEQVDRIETALKRSPVGGAGGADEAKLLGSAIAFKQMTNGIKGDLRTRITAENCDIDGYKAYFKAFDSYLRDGQNALGSDEGKALAVGRDPAGGFVVLPERDDQLVARIREISPIRGLVRVRSGNSPQLLIPVRRGKGGAYRVGETQKRNQTGTGRFGQATINANDIHSAPAVTADMLEDASFDVMGFLMDEMAQDFAETEAREVVVGTGVGEARGLLTIDTVALTDDNAVADDIEKVAVIKSGHATKITADKLIRQSVSLKDIYLANASWLMSRGAILQVMLLKDANDQYIWRPGLTAGQPQTLLGYAVNRSIDMPAVAAASKSVGFGDWMRAYTFYERRGLRVLRDEVTEHPFIVAKGSKRNGGDVVNAEAYSLMETGA